MINKAFDEQIGHNIEDYVNDIIVKSAKAKDYAKDLEEVFNFLKA